MRPDVREPLAAPAPDGDDVGWLITFSDLVLQLFAFVVVAAVCGGATRATAPAADKPSMATVAHVDGPRDDHTLEALAPAAAWAGDRDEARVGGIAAIGAGTARPDAATPPKDAATAPIDVATATARSADDVLTNEPPVVGAAGNPRRPRLRALGGYLDAFVAARGDADEATVTTGDDDVRLAFGGRLGFRPGSADLLPSGRSLLREVQRLASGMPHVTIEVAGYTDAVPIHTREFPSNLELSLARAARVTRELERDDPSLAVRTVALGFGPHHAIAPNDGPENRARNRRVEVRLVDGDQSMP